MLGYKHMDILVKNCASGALFLLLPQWNLMKCSWVIKGLVQKLLSGYSHSSRTLPLLWEIGRYNESEGDLVTGLTNFICSSLTPFCLFNLLLTSTATHPHSVEFQKWQDWLINIFMTNHLNYPKPWWASFWVTPWCKTDDPMMSWPLLSGSNYLLIGTEAVPLTRSNHIAMGTRLPLQGITVITISSKSLAKPVLR
jgi:hypothetical protein